MLVTIWSLPPDRKRPPAHVQKHSHVQAHSWISGFNQACSRNTHLAEDAAFPSFLPLTLGKNQAQEQALHHGSLGIVVLEKPLNTFTQLQFLRTSHQSAAKARL